MQKAAAQAPPQGGQVGRSPAVAQTSASPAPRPATADANQVVRTSAGAAPQGNNVPVAKTGSHTGPPKQPATAAYRGASPNPPQQSAPGSTSPAGEQVARTVVRQQQVSAQQPQQAPQLGSAQRPPQQQQAQYQTSQMTVQQQQSVQMLQQDHQHLPAAAVRHYPEPVSGFGRHDAETPTTMEQPVSPAGSTATLLMPQAGVPDIAKADAIGHLSNRIVALEEAHAKWATRVEDVASRLESRVQECINEFANFVPVALFQGSTAELQGLLQEVREELPQLRQEDAAQASDIRTLAEKQDHMFAELRNHCMIVEQNGRSDLAQAVAEVDAARQTSCQELETLLQTVEANVVSRLDHLDRSLSAEAAERGDADDKFAQTFRDALTQEVEKLQTNAMRMEATIMREMRERMDSQRTLREELQVQQQSLVRLSPRVDDLLMELRAELPRLAQECSTLRANIDRNEDTLTAYVSRTQQLEEGLSVETSSRTEAHDTFTRDMKTRLSKETQNLNSQVTDLQKTQAHLQNGVDAAKANAADAAERADRLQIQAATARELQEQTATQLQSLRDLSEQQFDRVKADITSLREWADEEILSRVGMIDTTMKREMTERKEVAKEIDARLSNNSERWCQLQAKFDDLLLSDAAAQRKSGWEAIKSGSAVSVS